MIVATIWHLCWNQYPKIFTSVLGIKSIGKSVLSPPLTKTPIHLLSMYNISYVVAMGHAYMTEYCKTYHLHTNEIIRIPDF